MIWLLLACGPAFESIDLQPYPNPFGQDDPQWAPQPHRDNPLEVAVAAGAAWVTLQGSPDEPGRHVARVALDTFEIDRLEVGSSPTGLAVHPDGRRIVVFNRFSNHASVIDAEAGRVVGRIPCDFYATEGVFSPDGDTLWVTSRWHDAVEAWDVVDDGRSLTRVGEPTRVPVGANPRDVAISGDGATVAVAALTGLEITLVDAATRTVRAQIDVGAPTNGLAFAGDLLVAATLSASTHHLADAGPDGDGDGEPGDGTPNVNFQDLQNDIALFDASTGEPVARYTSDTICCKDYRDVDPADLARRGDLLPPRDTWIVGGSLPEQVAVDGDRVVVTYSASNEWQVFTVAGAALVPGPVWPTVGHNPHGVALAGGRALIAHRLGETLGVYDLETGALVEEVEVGDLSGGAFPSTDAEIGELVNFVTAPLTVDGDQSCTHCHREGGNVDKAFSMPLFAYPGMASRMTMAYRGAADTRPWFFESAMDETNFRPVLNEFARIENFCCSDYTLFPDGIPADCAANPPPECATATSPGSLDGFDARRGTPFDPPRPTPYPTREDLVLARLSEMIGRETSFGDGLFQVDPITGERRPIALGFDGATRALGLFLLQEPRLLPNPNPADTAAVARGQALFERADVGCATCHPAPTFAVSTQVNPFDLPLLMGPVVTPQRDEHGTNLDLFSDGFTATFPLSESDTCDEVCGEAACAEDPAVCDDVRDVRLGVPGLRGIWDRASRMLHDGRARGLREVVCTPGHPALRPGEIGFDERDGVVDTHGATSHLSAQDVDDLIAYLQTL